MSLTCLLNAAISVAAERRPSRCYGPKMAAQQGPELVDTDPLVSEMVKNIGPGGMPTCEVKFHPEGWMLNKAFIPYADKIKNFKVRPDDVWILSFPKCGTTWSQEMLWLLRNNCDLDKANSELLYSRAPFLEMVAIADMGSDTIDEAAQLPSPRVIKSHLPPDLLPTEIWTVNPKLVYVYRNPKDAAISYCHHYHLWNEYVGSQELFIDAFLQDIVMYGPFWKHVLSFWNRRALPNLKFITFDSLKKDLRSVLHELAAHLEVEVPAEKETAVLEHLSFASMRDNPMLNFEAERKEMGKLDYSFFRQGDSGEWKKTLSPAQVARFDSWTASHIAGANFPYYS